MAIPTELLSKYEFDWEVLDVIIGGKSSIDSAKRLRIRSAEEANRFLECYGYDVENPIEKAELFGNFQEALTFIRKYFLQPANPDGLKIEIPRKIAELTDISQLILFASSPDPQQNTTALWACAIIKIMHTISHIDKDLRAPYFTDIQKQILDRFYRFIYSDENNQVYLGKDARDPDRVDLISFDSKPKKARDSVTIKLLHKSENVAEDIFDRVGIRFVTKNRFDAIRIVKFLKDRYVLMPANIKPSRSKNTLVDTEAFRGQVKSVLAEVDAGKLSPANVYEKISEFCEGPDADPRKDESKENPHTSQHYHALHFTCRQLIKIRNPMYDDVRELKNAIKRTAGDGSNSQELGTIIERMDLRNIQKEIRFFYPFEVQIYDEKSHLENMAGRSSHANYKKSQVQTAMKRVLGDLIRLSERQNASS